MSAAMDDPDLNRYLATHAVHADLVRLGFIDEVAPQRYQVHHPPDIIEAIRTGQLIGTHAEIAAHMVLQCTPPKGFWYAEDARDLIERIRDGGQPL